jgi:hypothetical protein
LNWNRKGLLEVLEQCLRSYAATIDKPRQLIVLDNANSDGSREVIARLCRELSCLKPIFLSRNLEVKPSASRWQEATGDLIHTGENDQDYLGGVPLRTSAFAGTGSIHQLRSHPFHETLRLSGANPPNNKPVN